MIWKIACVDSEKGYYLFKELPTVCEHVNITTTAAIEATCTNTGLTEIVTCDDCGFTITDGKTNEMAKNASADIDFYFCRCYNRE